MRRPSLAAGALLGSLTSLPLIALTYLGAQWAGLPFVPADLSSALWPFRSQPPGSWAAALWLVPGLLLVIGGGATAGLLVAWGLRLSPLSASSLGLLASGVAFAPAALVAYRRQLALGGAPVVGLLWLAILFLNWGILLGLALAHTAPSRPPDTQLAPAAEIQSRRAWLKLVIGSLVTAFAAWGAGGLAAWLRRPVEDVLVFEPTAPPAAPPAVVASQAGPLPPTVTAAPPTATPAAVLTSVAPRAANLAGSCSLLPVVAPTPYPHHLKFADLDPSTGLHITGQGKVLDVATYTLDVTGKVDNPLRFTYDDLRCLPRTGASVTVTCIGYFEDNAGWTGADLKALLEIVGVHKEAQGIRLTGADDFGNSVPINTALEGDNFLAYELEGEPLPILHGFPVRAMFPSLHGNTDVKWLVRINVY